MSQVFRLDRRAVGKISLLTAVFYFSAYFYRFFTLGYAHDSLLIDQSIDMTWQIQLGRFLQPVYLLFRGDIAVPYLIGLLAYLYLAAAICLVVDLLSLSSTLSISLVCMALCANTTLTRLHGTFHMMADSYMLALLLSVLCVFVAVRLRHGVWLAPVLLCGSAALYQSYVPVATVFFLILLVHHALDGFSFRALLLRGIRYLGVLIAGLVFYSLCLRVVYALTGQAAADSYNGMAGMGNFDGYSIVDLLRRAYLFPFEKMAHPQTAFPRAAAAAYGFLLLFSLAAVCYLLHARRIALPCAALTFVFLLLVPFGADFIYLLSKDMVHDLMIYAFFFCAVLPISLADRLRPLAGKAIRLTVPLAACCLSLVYFSDAIFANQFILRRDLSYNATLSTVTRMLERAVQVEGYQPGVTPVAFAGVMSDSHLYMERPGFEAINDFDFYVYSITYEQTYPWFFHMILGDPIRMADEAERMALAYSDEVLSMPVFPAEGSLKMVGETLVIRIGERYL